MLTEPIVLNIGICSCTDLYHGAMEGHEIVVPELTGHRYFGWHYFVPLKTPLIFRMREVSIPERHEQETLKKMGCHFFVDTHLAPPSSPSGWAVSLRTMHPIPEDPAGPYRCYVPELDQSGIRWCGWMQVQPPTTQEVETGIGQLIRRMDERGLYQWLRFVSPSRTLV